MKLFTEREGIIKCHELRYDSMNSREGTRGRGIFIPKEWFHTTDLVVLLFLMLRYPKFPTYNNLTYVATASVSFGL